jgi:P-type Cu+ transporter
VQDIPVKMGSAGFIKMDEFITQDTGTSVHVVMDKIHLGKFSVKNQYRPGIAEMVTYLKDDDNSLYVLSGDNDSENTNLKKIFGDDTPLRFNQSPQQKLDFIKALQQQGSHVLMLGDGLNDAGALMQSQVGIAVSENSAQFSPASDAILDGTKVSLLHNFISFAKSGKQIVTASFILSILYNMVGLSFAVQGILSPMIAAILMPASSISIVLFVSLYSSFAARQKGL